MTDAKFIEREREKCAEIIDHALSFTNGWWIDRERYLELCKQAASEIIAQVRRSTREEIAALAQTEYDRWGNYEHSDAIRALCNVLRSIREGMEG